MPKRCTCCPPGWALRERKNAHARHRYADSRTESLEKQRQYRLANPELIKKFKQGYAARHSAKLVAKTKAWKAANPERSREHVRGWWADHPEARRCAVERRRALKLSAPGDGVTAPQWRGRVEEFDGRCAYCLAGPAETMDHMTPLSRGGAHGMSNVVPACQSCNSKKHTRTLLEFARHCV